MSKFIVCFLILAFHVSSISAQPGSPDKSRVMDYFQNQQYEESLAYLLPFLQADSNNIQALGFAGYAEFMNDNSTNALADFSRIFSLDSTNLFALQYLAKINLGIHIETAKSYVYRLIQLQPSKSLYYRNLADIYRRENEKDSSLLYVEKAYALAPDDKKNIAGLAEACIDQKKYQRADSLLDDGLMKDSLHVPFLKLRLRSAYESKDFISALTPGEKMVQLEALFANSLIQLALSYYNLQKYSDCIRICEFMSQKQMGSESVLYYEARAWTKLKNFPSSDSLLETCLRLAISKPAELYYYSLGENAESMHKYARAIAMYDTAFFLFKNPLMLYNMGRVAETRLKNSLLAEKYYSRFLRIADTREADQAQAYHFLLARKKYSKNMNRRKS